MTEENNDFEVEFKNKKNYDNNWAIGIALILVGGLFLLDSFNLINIHLTNWWAIFILIPGFSMVSNSLQYYRETNSLDRRGLWGILMIIFAIALFFDISWNLIFPIGLVGVGVYLLLFRQ